MAKTTDELFAEATEADYETSEPVVLAASDTEEEFQFRIDEHLRTIAIPEKGVVAGVEGDLNVNITRFTMVRYYHGRDLSKLSIRINYRNANGQVNYYNVSDAAVSGDSIVFSWEYAADVTQYKGNVQFVVYLFSATNAVLKQRFFTTLGTLEVLEGLEVDSSIPVSEQTDILLHLKKDLSAYAEEVKKSLPADYTAMTEQVSSLKIDLENESQKTDVGTRYVEITDAVAVEKTYAQAGGWVGSEGSSVAYCQKKFSCRPGERYAITANAATTTENQTQMPLAVYYADEGSSLKKSVGSVSVDASTTPRMIYDEKIIIPDGCTYVRINSYGGTATSKIIIKKEVDIPVKECVDALRKEIRNLGDDVKINNYYLEDVASFDVVQGYYCNNNDVVERKGYAVSDYIPVTASENYLYRAQLLIDTSIGNIVLYDKNKKCIKTITRNGAAAECTEIQFTIPAGCVYIRLNAMSDVNIIIKRCVLSTMQQYVDEKTPIGYTELSFAPTELMNGIYNYSGAVTKGSWLGLVIDVRNVNLVRFEKSSNARIMAWTQEGEIVRLYSNESIEKMDVVVDVTNYEKVYIGQPKNEITIEKVQLYSDYAYRTYCLGKLNNFEYGEQLYDVRMEAVFDTARRGIFDAELRLSSIGNEYKNISIYWGNDGGVIEKFERINRDDIVVLPRCEVKYTGFNECQLIPEGVNKIYALSAGETVGVLDIPAQKCLDTEMLGTKKYTFGILSDTHIGATEDSEAHLRKAMHMYADNNVDFIIHCGDVTDYAYAEQFEKYKKVVDEYEIKVYTIPGNHDVRQMPTADNYKNYLGDTIYSENLNGDLFVFAGHTYSQDGYGNWLTKDGIENVRELLESAVNSEKMHRVFVVIHERLQNSVGNPFGAAVGDECLRDPFLAEFTEMVKKYRSVICYNGHSHYKANVQEYDSNASFKHFENNGIYNVNVSSCCYPKIIDSTGTGKGSSRWSDSEICIVDVYENYVIHRAYNSIENGTDVDKYIPLGCMLLKTDDKYVFTS